MKISQQQLISAESVSAFKFKVSESGSYFFSKGAMAFFATRNLALYRGVVLVGSDLNAPEGYPHHWVRVFYKYVGSNGNEYVTGKKVAESHSRAYAVQYAKALAAKIVKEGEVEVPEEEPVQVGAGVNSL